MSETMDPNIAPFTAIGDAWQMRPETRATLLIALLLAPIGLLVLYVDSPLFFTFYAASIFGVLAFSVYLLRKNVGWVMVSIFFLAVCFQNVSLGWMLNFQPHPALVPMLVLIETKTAFLFGAFGIVICWRLWSRRETTKKDVGFYFGPAFVIIVLAGYVFSDAVLFTKAAELRNLLTPLAAWYVGKFCVRRERDISQIFGVILAAGMLLSIFSVLELTIKDFWSEYLHKDMLMELKGPTADQTDFLGGTLVDRLFTGVGSPINASFIFGMLFLITLFSRKHFWAALFGIQTLLTLAKSGIMVAVVGLLFFLLRKKLMNASSRLRVLIAVPLIVLALMTAYLWYSGTELSEITDSSGQVSNTAAGHLRGLAGAIIQLPSAPWGHGLGTSGTMSEVGTITGMTGESDSDFEHRYEIGSESTVGVMLYQVGIVGFLGFAGWCFCRMEELFRCSKQFRYSIPHYSNLALAGMAALFGVFMSAFGTEAATVPQTGGTIFLIGGVIAGIGDKFSDVAISTAS